MMGTTLQIECQYLGEDTIQKLLIEAFQLYLSRILEENENGAVSC